MFKCLMIEKKLYEYLNNTLSEEERLNVKKHLDGCALCRAKLDQMVQLIDAVQSKAAPSPSKEFWHTFKAELDQKLNARLVPPLKSQPSWRHTLKPVFAVISVVIIVFGLYLSFHSRAVYLGKEEMSLIEELSILDEVISQPYFNHHEDAYIEEFYIQQQLG